MNELFAVLAQAVSARYYQGFTIQLTTDPWARSIGHVWEYTDGEVIRGFASKEECVDDIDERLQLGRWEVVFDWPRVHYCKYTYWYSDAIEFAGTYTKAGKEVTEDWVNRKILVK
jgi:hypothetical protein